MGSIHPPILQLPALMNEDLVDRPIRNMLRSIRRHVWAKEVIPNIVQIANFEIVPGIINYMARHQHLDVIRSDRLPSSRYGYAISIHQYHMDQRICLLHFGKEYLL